VLHLQETIGAALDVLANLVPMSRAVQECAKDEHVQRTQEKVHTLLFLCRHSRPSTPG